MQRSFSGWIGALLFLGLVTPAFSFQKQGEEPWWVAFQAQYQMAQDEGLTFRWNDATSRIDVDGIVEFAFIGKARQMDPRQKDLVMRMYVNTIQRHWSLPFEGAEERSDVNACGRDFGGFNYIGLNLHMVHADKPVSPGANRIYLYFAEQVPKELELRNFLHTTFPTISGNEGDFEDDPFWSRKGEGVLPAFTQFLPLPMEAGTVVFDSFTPFDGSTPSWNLFVGHEFGHVLGLPDGWTLKGDQVVVTDTALMSYLYWELNPEPRASHAYFAEILSRIFLCDVSWSANGKTYWVAPGR